MTSISRRLLRLRTKVANVLGGKTVSGHPGLAPITYPRTPRSRLLLLRWTDQFLSMHPNATDAELTAIIRKLAVFMIRHGRDEFLPEEIIGGLRWFAGRPGAITSKLGFGGAVRLKRDERIRILRECVRRPRVLFRASMREPDPAPVVWLQHNTFTLSELVHPEHLLTVGTQAGNCLGRPHLAAGYWLRISEGRGRLFAITQGELLCALFMLGGSEYLEWSYLNTPEGLRDFVSRSVAALDQRVGPHGVNPPFIPEKFRREPGGDANRTGETCRPGDAP